MKINLVETNDLITAAYWGCKCTDRSIFIMQKVSYKDGDTGETQERFFVWGNSDKPPRCPYCGELMNLLHIKGDR